MTASLHSRSLGKSLEKSLGTSLSCPMPGVACASLQHGKDSLQRGATNKLQLSSSSHRSTAPMTKPKKILPQPRPSTFESSFRCVYVIQQQKNQFHLLPLAARHVVALLFDWLG